MRNSIKLAAVLIAVTATTASAQTGGRNSNGVPPGQRPPDGMCRVWVDGMAPGQQSAVTDCATAQAQSRITANSRVIYGGNPGRNRNDSGDVFSRRRQLPDGSWVVERVRRDASGNLTVVSTRAVNANGDWDKRGRKHGNKEWKKGRKHGDNEMNDDRADERKVAKEDLKDHQKMEKEQLKAQYDDKGEKGGKGKGKH